MAALHEKGQASEAITRTSPTQEGDNGAKTIERIIDDPSMIIDWTR